MKDSNRKSNVLIAEWEGYESYEFRGYTMIEFADDNHRTDVDLHYHTSWDWLMPVVSKCREESNAEDSHWEAIYYSLEGCDIDVTYQAVVEFIKQHNKS